MPDFGYFIIGFAAICFGAYNEIKKYWNKEYNPYVFRFKGESKGDSKIALANVITVVPMFIMKQRALKGIYILVGAGTLLATINVLNYLCYKSKKDKAIIKQTIILDILFLTFLGLVIFLFFMLKY